MISSGVPKASVFGPLLFLININNQGIGTNCNLSKLADEIKIGRITDENKSAGGPK